MKNLSKTRFLQFLTKMAKSPLIILRIEKFKNSLVAGNKPVLQDGLDPLLVHPQAFLWVSDGRMGFIWNTGSGPLNSPGVNFMFTVQKDAAITLY